MERAMEENERIEISSEMGKTKISHDVERSKINVHSTMLPLCWYRLAFESYGIHVCLKYLNLDFYLNHCNTLANQ
ncbi:CLUMA_CG019242, isoform A [Clunio marinus]|uniref:CLUMA_CG019242, isoform A n=1 Tax=Clunio marinus TaxID=568069 RepID=A0A1J1J233_9DIPT|nr:CLUMA_CG019242, isoform A [Clunio marinus]